MWQANEAQDVGLYVVVFPSGLRVFMLFMQGNSLLAYYGNYLADFG